MSNSNFKDNIKVNDEKLIPIKPLEKCVWVMGITGRTVNFSDIMEQNGLDVKQYKNYNYLINNQLAHLEFSLRKGEISQEEFEQKCKETYEKFDINFDILSQNGLDLDTSDKNNNLLKEFKNENYYKTASDEDIKKKMDNLEQSAKSFDLGLSDKFQKQAEIYYEKQKEKESNKTNSLKEQDNERT